GDIWFARPMGAPVTCLLIAGIAFVAGRWFFGVRPGALAIKLLAAAFVLLPLMGLLGVVQRATHPAGVEDRTMVVGTLAAMLAARGAAGVGLARGEDRGQGVRDPGPSRRIPRPPDRRREGPGARRRPLRRAQGDERRDARRAAGSRRKGSRGRGRAARQDRAA